MYVRELSCSQKLEPYDYHLALNFIFQIQGDAVWESNNDDKVGAVNFNFDQSL